MFTGLVRESAIVADLKALPNNLWKIECLTRIPEAKDWPVGASIALNGVCLTLVASSSEPNDCRRITFEISAETLSRTSFEDVKIGSKIHLEPSLKVGDALGGHWVLGHVDGCGRVSKIEFQGECLFVEISIENRDRHRIAPYVVEKGSIAVDGVSLTVNSLTETAEETRFSLLLIPHTLKVTHFAELKLGQIVNLESDVLGKFSARDRQFRNEFGRDLI